MKALIKIAASLLLTAGSFAANAQDMEAYLSKSCKQLDTAKTLEQVNKASSSFDISAMKWSKEYIANYYAAYSKTILSFMYPEADMKTKDLVLDQADKYFEKAKALAPESDETYVLAALLAQARMSVDGQNRWMKYGKIFEENLEKAKAINPENPRIYYLKGTSTFYTPKMFGGGKKNAKPYFEKAKELYAKQDTTSVLKPIWGSVQTDYFIGECSNEDKD
ncbi:MAG TPA: hypothetical protein VK177_18410 [Flavobacteriales bacterium]|nr:hypothetical protein [Flavobacteriales bacterium]